MPIVLLVITIYQMIFHSLSLFLPFATIFHYSPHFSQFESIFLNFCQEKTHSIIRVYSRPKQAYPNQYVLLYFSLLIILIKSVQVFQEKKNLSTICSFLFFLILIVTKLILPMYLKLRMGYLILNRLDPSLSQNYYQLSSLNFLLYFELKTY